MKRLRISFYFNGDFPEGGATVTRIKGYLKYLKQNHDVRVNILWQDSFSNSGINHKISGEWENIPFQFFNKRTKRPSSNIYKFFDTCRAWWNASIDLIKNRKNTDIIYIYNPEIHYSFPILLLAKLYKIPVVAEQTELQSAIYLQPGVKMQFFYYLKRYNEKKIYKWCSSLIVISHALENFYSQTFKKENIHLIPAMVDLERFQPSNISKKYTIGYIGSFGVKDGIPYILHAFKQALYKIPELKLRLIGNYDEYPNLVKQIKFYQIEDVVELIGRATYEEVPILLSGCDLLLCTRINSVYTNHGFPSKLVEYAALEIPVIATDVSDINNYFHRAMTIIPPEDVQALEEAIIGRYQQSEVYIQMAKDARKIAENFDVNRCGKMLEEVLKTSIK